MPASAGVDDETNSSATSSSLTTIASASEESILENIGSPFSSVLRFLWAAYHHPTVITAPTTVPLQDETTMLWEKDSRARELPQAPTESIPASTAAGPGAEAPPAGGATIAITKLAASMIKHQEAQLRAQEEKGDSRLKAWKKLPKIQQDIILLGGIEEDGAIPQAATDEMLAILGCSNGPQVDQYLRQSMQSHNMTLEPGFCTALNKGIFVSPDDSSMPKNFTPFLTPPIKDDEDIEESTNLLKLAVQEKYDQQDLVLLTKMDIAIPMQTQELKHQVKNIAGLAGRCFGDSSILYASIKTVADHIDRKENSYSHEFRQEKFFGGHFLDKLHWRIHRFLDSCAHGDPERVDTDKLDFSDMMQQIECREYNTKVPIWIRKLVKKREKKWSRHYMKVVTAAAGVVAVASNAVSLIHKTAIAAVASKTTTY